MRLLRLLTGLALMLALATATASAQRTTTPAGGELSPGLPSGSTRGAAPIPATPTAPLPNTAMPGTPLPGGAVLFGSHYVGFARDRDVIKVGANIGQFDRIQLRVLINDIYINELEVVFGNGESQKLIVDTEIKRNSRTRWLELKGDRFISHINLIYRSRLNLKGQQALIEVYGQYSEGWLGPNGRGRAFNEGWVLIGAQPAGSFLRTQAEVIPVGRNEGLFKRVRVTVKNRALVFDEIRIVYGSGEEEAFAVKRTLDAGDTFGPVDLRGGNRAIREIRARYRSAVLDAKAQRGGPAVVEIWAQH